jgi:hypothetical protein
MSRQAGVYSETQIASVLDISLSQLSAERGSLWSEGLHELERKLSVARVLLGPKNAANHRDTKLRKIGSVQ